MQVPAYAEYLESCGLSFQLIVDNPQRKNHAEIKVSKQMDELLMTMLDEASCKRPTSVPSWVLLQTSSRRAPTGRTDKRRLTPVEENTRDLSLLSLREASKKMLAPELKKRGRIIFTGKSTLHSSPRL